MPVWVLKLGIVALCTYVAADRIVPKRFACECLEAPAVQSRGASYAKPDDAATSPQDEIGSYSRDENDGSMRILIVEDDEKTANYLKRGLSEAGHVVDRARDGATGLAMALEDIYDVLVLDRMLPHMDGIELIKGIRGRGNHVPALMLSARASTQDRIEGLQAGCDDYIAKPYAFLEILARLDALARRVQPTRRQAVLKVADLELDLLGRRAVRGAWRIDLQHREFLLLELLMRHAGQIVTRSMLLEAAWPYDFEPRSNIVDMHIHRLRGKVDEGFVTPLIHTVPGSGYILGPQRP